MIRTLGLYQPYAGLMLYGKIETRWIMNRKKAPYPLGKYVLYATKKQYSMSEVKKISSDCYDGIIKLKNTDHVLSLIGKAICTGDLVRIIDPITVDVKNTFVDFIYGDGYRRVGLVFENVKRIKPFPFKGKQGVGYLSEDDEKKIVYT